uniref:ABC transporter ATP-binding protein n=1 Tax=Candidatus Caldatribacterium saccharofermentans TaxID=1454753 RepID=A0A7V4TF08_9BACT
MLVVENLWVAYGGIVALKGISFEVQQQEIVALIGSNGAGKSTTLMSISNLVKKQSGRVVFCGEDITYEKPHVIVRKGLCHVPEGRRIFPYLTVEENLIMGMFGNPQKEKGVVQENLDRVYRLFPRLKERRKQPGGTLSGGEQQMLAIGRGLMLSPKLMMLDEPSLGLAPIVVEQIFELILSIRNMGTTILLIEQNANMALQIANRAYVLEVGKIVLSGNAQELLCDPRVVGAYLGVG